MSLPTTHDSQRSHPAGITSCNHSSQMCAAVMPDPPQNLQNPRGRGAISESLDGECFRVNFRVWLIRLAVLLL